MNLIIALWLLLSGPSVNLTLSPQVGMAPLTVHANLRAPRGSWVCVKMNWDEQTIPLSCFSMSSAQDQRKYVFGEGTFRVWLEARLSDGTFASSPPLTVEVR